MANAQVFLSAVTAEFRSYRDALRRDLERPNVTVKVQEDFIATGTETLDKLDDYIQSCHAVVHLVGDMTGADAEPPSVAVIRERYPDFAARLPPVAPFLKPGAAALSYTQWEAWLALYHRKPLFIAEPDDGAPRDARYRLDQRQRAAQREHLDRLKAMGRHAEIRFANADRLAVAILRSKLQEILAAAGATDRRADAPADAGGLLTRFGLTHAPTAFRRTVENFVRLYLGTAQSPVPFGGRSREFEALNAWLEAQPETSATALLGGEPGSTNLLITAPPGRGKTALLVRWIEQLDDDWSIVFVPVSIRAGTNEALTFYHALASRLAAILEELLPEPRADPAAYYREKAIDYLDRIRKGSRRCLLVIDGLDEARGWRMDTSVLPLEPSPYLKIVVSARELAGDSGSHNWLHRLGWAPPQSSARTLRVEPLDRQGIADVLARMAFPIAPLSKDVDIIDELYRLTDGGDPVVLHFYVNDLQSKGAAAARLEPKDLRTLEPGFGPYIKRWIDEQKSEWKHSGAGVDEELVHAMLAVLAGAFGPLKLVELEEVVARVLPGNRIFSVTTVEPLRRFLVGDGRENGHALAHPKLADFLRRDYFSGSRIVRTTQDAFLAWMRSVVAGLNDGGRRPGDTPAYALLFYTQHLSELPASEALALYRELVEDGWRRAWEAREGGFQGFARDIELAARAFRAAADADSDRLRDPRTGLGAQVRCALCLSSMMSMGHGAGGEVLAEFIRSRVITPKHALYLALLKEEKQRVRALETIVGLLPPELRLQAYAATADIADPGERIAALVAIAPHLPERDGENALRSALRTMRMIGEPRERDAAYWKLNSALPQTPWAEVLAAEIDQARQDERAAQQSGNEQAPPSGTGAAGAASSLDHDERRRKWLLEREAARPDLSQARIREILSTISDWSDIHAKQIVEVVASRLSRDLQIFALESVARGGLWREEMLSALVPFLEPDLLDRVVVDLTGSPGYGLAKPLAAVAARLDAAGLARALRRVIGMTDEFHRTRALEAIAPVLPPELVEEALRWSRGLAGYYASATLGVLVPYLPPGQAIDMARSATGDARAEILVALAPTIPAQRLAEAVELAAGIGDVTERGRVLAGVLPRLRDAGLSAAIADAYSVAFAIGDESFRALAQAALLPYLGRDDARARLDELSTELGRPLHGHDDGVRFVHVMAVALASELLAAAKGESALDLAVAAARDLGDTKLRAMALGALTARLPPGRDATVMNEAVELARSNRSEGAVTLAFLAAFRAPGDVQPALEAAGRDAALMPHEDDRRGTKALIQVISALSAGGEAAKMHDEVTKALDTIEGKPMKESALIVPLLILLFSPQLPMRERQELIRAVLDALPVIEEAEPRGLMLAAIAPYLPTPDLWPCVRELLDMGARSPRPGFLVGLALSQGLVGKIFKRNPAVGGNRIPGSPLERLGGPDAVIETMDAIRDVGAWWA